MTLPTAFCPPVGFFALLAENPVVYLEACEHYVKQSWRNRCRILTAGGPMDFNVPVVHSSEDGTSIFRTRMDRVLVDYSTPWLERFEYAVESAYGNSPFFIYYRDAFFAILDSRPRTLWELNLRIIEFFCNKIGIAPELLATESFDPQRHGPDPIHPKRPDSILADRGLDRPYWQVFRQKFGFVGGLSIMDLLFNEGPESICWIKK